MSKNNWVDLDLDGIRKDRTLAKVVMEIAAQNTNDTNARNIDIDIGAVSRGVGRLVVTDDDPDGYLDLSHAYTMFAPSTKGGDDTKAGIFNVGEKEFLAFCREGTITSTTGKVIFHSDGRRTRSDKGIDVGSVHDFHLKMTLPEQAAIVAKLREVIFHDDKTVTVNGEVLKPRPVLKETATKLFLVKARPDDPYQFVDLERVTRITLHEPGTGGPALHVLGMPVQAIDCAYSVNVHGRLRLDQKRDQVKQAMLDRIMAAVVNLLAEEDALTVDDIEWARPTLGKHSSPKATKVMVDHLFGEDAMVANPRDRAANSEAASFGHSVVYGGSLPKEAWRALDRAREVYTDLVPSTSVKYGERVGGQLGNPIPSSEWTDDAVRVVRYVKNAFAVCFPHDGDLAVTLYDGDKGEGCVAVGDRNEIGFNQGGIGWAWFERSNNERIMETIIHEFGHHAQFGTLGGHSFAWACSCIEVGAKLAMWGELP